VTGALAAGFLIGLSAAVLSGGAAMLVMETSAHTGFGVATAAGAGIATGDAVWATVAVAAGAAVSRLLAPWVVVLHWLAIAVLLLIEVLAVRQLVHPGAGTVPTRTWHGGSPIRAYAEFLAFTLMNAVTVIYFLSLIVAAAPPYRAVEAATFVVGAFAASLSWQLALVGAGARLGRTFSDRARRRILLVDCGLLAVFIGYVALGLYRAWVGLTG
jgi:threonine/homoserine/homoserine lactone efflux protein